MEHKNIIIFSSYPQMGTTHDKKIVGVASYTKNLLLHIKKIVPDVNLRVFAEMWGRPESYLEKGIRVERVWRRRDPIRLFLAFADMFRNPIDTVWISYEIGMVGGYFSNILFLIMMAILRLRKKEMVIILHQVVANFDSKLMNSVKNMLYQYLLAVASRIVVFEERFKTELYNDDKVLVIPHAVEPAKKRDPAKARATVNLDPSAFYLLYFGFISPYKGVDALLDIYNADSPEKLIIAGGKNPNLTFFSNSRSYSSYIRQVTVKAKKKEAVATGFVEEEDIPAYFTAADAVVLPYKMFFSSSGPLSLAFSYDKPVLLSPALAGYFETADFRKALVQSNLTVEDFLFDFTAESFAAAIARLHEKRDQFVQFSRLMREARSWPVIANHYVNLLVKQTSLPVLTATPLSPRRFRFGIRARN